MLSFKPSQTVTDKDMKGEDDVDKYVIFPIAFPELWNLYETHKDAFWVPKEIDFTKDYDAFKQCSSPVQRLIIYILSFFAAFDMLVVENLAKRFMSDVNIPAAQAFYGFQIAMETIHAVTYGIMIETLVPDKNEQKKARRAIIDNPVIKKMADWAKKWLNTQDRPFSHRLIAFACVEGIFFSGAFCIIFWLKQYYPSLFGLYMSNEFISRDEGLHCDFACTLYSLLEQPLKTTDETVHEIVKEAIDIQIEFAEQILEEDQIGMNKELLKQYICYVSNRLVKQLGHKQVYDDIQNPFPFMEKISLPGKTSFFERRVSEYSMATATEPVQETEAVGQKLGSFVMKNDF